MRVILKCSRQGSPEDAPINLQSLLAEGACTSSVAENSHNKFTGAKHPRVSKQGVEVPANQSNHDAIKSLSNLVSTVDDNITQCDSIDLFPYDVVSCYDPMLCVLSSPAML